MDAQEFMQKHADSAVAGKIQEVLADLTPEAMGQVGPLMAGGPNPAKANTVVPVGVEGDDHIFDVTYTGDGGASASMREWVRKNEEGIWKIVKLAKPS